MIKREEIIGDCRLILGDNMPLMADMADNEFQLAIVDPEYGIGEDGGKDRRGKSKHEKKNWDEKPPADEYFHELFRVSRGQIIWGGNYFVNILSPSMGWVCWDKKLDKSDFSDFELAYTSFDRAAKIFRYSKNGGSRTPAALADIIHPTQKPVALYRWLLKNYAKPGDHILDTHGGSMSSVIACMEMGFKITCIEIDEDYFNAGVERVKQATRQGKLFQPPKQQPKPQGLF